MTRMLIIDRQWLRTNDMKQKGCLWTKPLPQNSRHWDELGLRNSKYSCGLAACELILLTGLSEQYCITHCLRSQLLRQITVSSLEARAGRNMEYLKTSSFPYSLEFPLNVYLSLAINWSTRARSSEAANMQEPGMWQGRGLHSEASI